MPRSPSGLTWGRLYDASAQRRSTRRRIRTALHGFLVGSALGCTATESQPIEPTLPPGTQSVLIMSEIFETRRGYAADLRTVDPNALPLFPDVAGEVPFFFLVGTYDQTLEELAVEPGERTLGTGEMPSGFTTLAALSGQADEPGSWQNIQAVPESWKNVGWPDSLTIRCLDRGGCISAESDVPACVAACDAPEVAPPIPPEPPSLTPCPSGWREIHTDASVYCEPWPEAGHKSVCPPGTAHFAGGSDCEPMGSACATDGWPQLSEAVWVRSGAQAGTGTREAPFGTLAEALATSPSVVALHSGVYREPVRLTRPTSLRGACAAETELAGVVTVESTGVEISDLGITAGLSLKPQARAQISGVTFRAGMQVDHAEATMQNVHFSSVDTPLQVLQGSHLTGSRIVFEKVGPQWILVDAARAELTGVVVFGQTGAPSASREGGLVDRGGRIEVKQSVFENRAYQVLGADRASMIAMDQSVVRGVSGDLVLDEGGSAYALSARSSSISVQRSLVQQFEGVGIVAEQRGYADIEDVVFLDGLTGIGEAGATALLIRDHSTGQIERNAFHRHAETGIRIIADSSAEARDIIATDMKNDEHKAEAFYIVENSRALIQRVRVRNVSGVGVHYGSDDTVVDAEDIDIADTYVYVDEGPELDRRGFGILGFDSALGRFNRVRVRNAESYGVLTEESAKLTVSNLEVRDTRPEDCHADPRSCEGTRQCALIATESSHLEVDGFIFENNAGCAMRATFNGTAKLSRGSMSGHRVLFETQETEVDLEGWLKGVTASDYEEVWVSVDRN